MADSFTKLFSSITDSTVWDEDSDTRIVWITMLAMADKGGYVGASVTGLAARARVSRECVLAALEKFMTPDPYSRTKDHEGRRVAEVDRGWQLLNHAAFRLKRDAEIRQAQNAEAQARRRARKAADVSKSVADVGDASAESAQADADADTSLREERVRATPLDFPDARPANDQGVSSARTQTFRDIVTSEAFAAQWTPSPRLNATHQRQAVERAADLALGQGIGFEAACRLLVRSALSEAKSTKKPLGFVLLECLVKQPEPDGNVLPAGISEWK